MYNEAIKTRYRQEREKTVVVPQHALRLDFEKTSSFEEQLNKDAYDFTIYEILNMYKTWNSKSIDTLYVINNRLSQYTQWALEQNLVIDSQNHYLEINRDMLMGCINIVAQQNRIVSREQMIAWCSRLPNACDKFVFLGLYEGLNGNLYEDFWNASIDDIDKEKKTIRVKRGVIPISDSLIEYAEESNNTLELYPMSGDMERITRLVENGKIIKQKINTKYDDPLHNKKNVYIAIVRVCKFLDIDRWFNTRQAIESGMINFIRQGMQRYDLSFHDYLWSNHKREVEQQYNRKIVRSSFYTKYKNIFEPSEN